VDDLWTRMWADLVGRLTGPFAFRFVLQPTMGLIFAFRDGVHDAKTGTPPYLWSMLVTPGARATLLEEGWRKVGRVVMLGVIMDVLYQLIVLRWIYPGELMVMLVLLCVLPYLLLRGPVNRVARRWIHPQRAEVQ
jgi:hypothetical protein